jgi:hypothetical protein
VNDHFAVRTGREAMIECFKLPSQFHEVIDLAVGHHADRSIFVEKGLLPGGQ